MQFPLAQLMNYRSMNWLKGAGSDLCDCEIMNPLSWERFLKGQGPILVSPLPNEKLESAILEVTSTEATVFLSQLALDKGLVQIQLGLPQEGLFL